MTIKLYEELAFRLISLEFFYMGPFPLKIDFKRGKMVQNKPLHTVVHYVASVSFAFTFGLLCLATAIYMGLLNPRPGFGRVNSGIFTIICAVFSALAVITFYSSKILDAIISAFNETLKLVVDLDKDIPENKRYLTKQLRRFDASPFLALAVVPGGAFLPFSIAFAAQYAHFGCLHFVLDEILPAPMYRDTNTVYFSMLIPFLFDFITGAEATRTFLFGCCSIFMLGNRGLNALRVVILQISSFTVFYRYYIMGTLLFKKIEGLVHISVYIILNIGFWCVVFFSWICVKCQATVVTLPVYVVASFILGVLVVGHIVALPLLCLAFDMSEYVVKLHRLRARLYFSKLKFLMLKINVKKAKSILPVRLRYGPFWYIKGDFLGEYVWMIILRCFDAILIIDF